MLENVLALRGPSSSLVPFDSPEWSRLEQELGIAFPPDYKEFLAQCGPGEIKDYLTIVSPFIDGPNLQQLLAFETRRRNFVLEGNPEETEGMFPYRIFPEPKGLLPWGRDNNGGTYYWLTSAAPPADWDVAEFQDNEWGEYSGTMSEFLQDVFDGTYQSVAMGTPHGPDDPGGPHSPWLFVPWPNGGMPSPIWRDR